MTTTAHFALAESPLSSVLLAPIRDTARTRRYQAALDRRIANLKACWSLKHGLRVRGMVAGEQGEPGTVDVVLDDALPHLTVPDYWNLEEADRLAATPDAINRVYNINRGREGTAPLLIAAFCWYSPLSRYHRDPELLAFFANGLRFHASSIGHTGRLGTYALNGEGWANGWDIEGLIYGMVFTHEHLPAELISLVLASFERAANHLAGLDQHDPTVVGSIGNQRAVWCLGVHLYGQLLGRADLCELSDRIWDDTSPRVLDISGQVIEQLGPCMHYSKTAFIYAWLNHVIRNDRRADARILGCLQWFQKRFTRSGYPIAGPSTRRHYETAPAGISDLWPAAEQFASHDPSILDFVDTVAAKAATHRPEPPADMFDIASSHGGSTLMWAILMTGDAPSPAAPVAPPRGVSAHRSTTHLKRVVLSYANVQYDYQTHFNFTDFLPFGGLQTWALDQEPPIVHPTRVCPSTTVCEGIDTARQGTSHNWGMYGAGVIGIDGYFRQAESDDDLDLLVARFHTLWQVGVFTARSAVLLQFGGPTPRTTSWTLNRIEPAAPLIEKRMVRFDGRRGCLHSTAGKPDLIQGHDAQQLVYRWKTPWAAFGFSDDSLAFDASHDPIRDRRLRFRDACGDYQLLLHDGFFLEPNPGNFSIDTFTLTYRGTSAKRRSG